MTQYIPRQRSPQLGLRTVIVGSGEAGRALVRDLLKVSSFGLLPVAFVDDDPELNGTSIEGLPILGSTKELCRILQEVSADVAVIAIPSLPVKDIHRIGQLAASCGVSIRHLPPFLAALQRDIAGTDLHTLDVRQLIGRSELHVASRRAGDVLTGKRVLVTGAGGSIGSELCRQVFAFSPESLVMVDHDESNLHRLQLDVWGEALLDTDALVVADIRDDERIHQIFRDVRPEVVFHAAALKHLPVLERHPCEAVKSNVKGTENLVQACLAHDVERFILISTDKAANPSSVLGATKRLAELVLESYRGFGGTELSAVRFGNVLGSRGSLLHVLKEQMAAGAEVTVTHPDATRFFMTIEEAVGLVLEAARMAADSGVFVLDMGDPVRILDVVHNFARQLNVRELDVRFTGLRPGEKLNEELFGEGENELASDHPGISMARATPLPPRFRSTLHDLYDAAAHNRADEVLSFLADLIPEYAPTPRLLAAVGAEGIYPDDY
jgi:FlaA1/EpsC-like NDP-sugar epimerase